MTRAKWLALAAAAVIGFALPVWLPWTGVTIR